MSSDISIYERQARAIIEAGMELYGSMPILSDRFGSQIDGGGLYVVRPAELALVLKLAASKDTRKLPNYVEKRGY